MSTALDTRYESAAIRREATRLRQSVDTVLAQAAAVTDRRRRDLLARAVSVIQKAQRVREAAANLTTRTGSEALLVCATFEETASLMNAARDRIIALDTDRCFAGAYGSPVALARLIENWLTFTGGQARSERARMKTWASPPIVTVKTKSADGKPLVRVTASSDVEDLEGDVFELSALREMRDGFKGRLAFMNHRYSVPSDVFGTITDTSLHKRAGNTFLDMVIAVETANPVALQTHAMIAQGTRLGVSVGVLLREAERRRDANGKPINGLAIRHVTPLETSIVGIPANQTAWVNN